MKRADRVARLREVARCRRDPAYFVDTYCNIFDPVAGAWIPFILWPEQRDTLHAIDNNKLVIVLKARQLGLSWLVLCYMLWLMLFHPIVVGLVFSRRDDEAVYLLGDERLRGVWRRLPDWMMRGPAPLTSNDHEWSLTNGSVARCFPTTAGDSYTASIAIVDEADLVPDLNRLMRAVKPTIDAGGRMLLVSRSEKSEPGSEFKSIYRAAMGGHSEWAPVFLPWYVHPDRDDDWYTAQKQEIEERTGSDDDLKEQYPATVAEALSPRTLDKRIAPTWIEQCYRESALMQRTQYDGGPVVPQLLVYRLPDPDRAYCLGVDTAEGNPLSDESSITVLAVDSGEEVAQLSMRMEPATTAAHGMKLSEWYNMAPIMVERNNHGHAVLLWLEDNARTIKLLNGHDDKIGFLSSSLGKAMLYTVAADAFKNYETVIHTYESVSQLQSIEGSTLRAPDGEHDDRADSYALALAARKELTRYASREPVKKEKPKSPMWAQASGV